MIKIVSTDKINPLIVNLLQYGAIIFILSGCAYAFYSFYSLSPVNLFINADLVHLPVMFADIAGNWRNFGGWNLPEAPYYFPDMVLFFAINFLVKNKFFSIEIYGIIQLLLLFLTITWLYFELGGQNKKIYNFNFLLGISILSITHLFILNPYQVLSNVYVYFLVSYVHFGTYVFSLIFLFLCLRYLQQGNLYILTVNLCLITIVVLSDLLLCTYFIIPFLIVSVLSLRLNIFQQSRIKILAISIGISSVSAYLFSKLLDSLSADTAIELNLEKIFTSITQFARDIGQLGTAEQQFAFCFSLLPLIYIFLVTFLSLPNLAFSATHRSQEQQQQIVRWLFTKVFVLISILVTVVAVFALGKYIDLNSIRYFLPLFYSPGIFLLLSLGLAIEQVEQQYVKIIELALATLLGITLVILTSSVKFQPITQLFPAPEYASCFSKFTPTAGLAGYWESKPLILYSRRQLQIATITPNGEPYQWNNNQYWYIDNWHNPGSLPNFQFILMRSLDKNAIEQTYGKPNRVSACADSEIWWYDDPDRLYLNLMKDHWSPFERAIAARKMINIPAGLLGGNIGQTEGLWKRTAIEGRDSTGYLGFGLSLKLPSGKYLAQIEYQSSDPIPTKPNANVDIFVHSPLKDKGELAVQPMPITARTDKVFNLEFTLARESTAEVRVFYQGHGTLAVKQIKFQRI
jgi:hypothetical protein